MRYFHILAILLLIVTPAFAEEIVEVSEPVSEEFAEIRVGESTPTVDFGTMAPVFRASRGTCQQGCTDHCDDEATACFAACSPTDLLCRSDCICDRFWCYKVECECSDDPPPGPCSM